MREKIYSDQLSEYRSIEAKEFDDGDVETQFKYLTLERGIAYGTS